MRSIAFGVALAACLVAACGDDSSGSSGTDGGGGGGSVQGSCDIMGASHGCIDYAGFPGDTAQLEMICTSSMGTYSSGSACSHAGAVGGCRSMAGAGGFTQTTWHYDGDSATVMMTCSATSATFVAP